MIHCKKCLTVFTNSVGSGTVLCKECQAKGDPDIFDTQPTCGELSCDECNERYAKAVNRIAVLEEVFRKLQMTGLAVEAENTKLVELSDDWHQEEPLAYLVKCFDTTIEEYKVFADKREAESFAAIQESDSDDNGQPADWLVYPLYAGHPEE